MGGCIRSDRMHKLYTSHSLSRHPATFSGGVGSFGLSQRDKSAFRCGMSTPCVAQCGNCQSAGISAKLHHPTGKGFGLAISCRWGYVVDMPCRGNGVRVVIAVAAAFAVVLLAVVVVALFCENGEDVVVKL